MGAQVLILSKLITFDQFLMEKLTFKVVFDDILYLQKFILQIINNTENLCFADCTYFGVFFYLSITSNHYKSTKNIILRHKSLKIIIQIYLSWFFQFLDFYKKRLIKANFVCVNHLGGQFQAPKLALIVSLIESTIVRHTLRNISGFESEGIGPPWAEIQGKKSHFQKRKL